MSAPLSHMETWSQKWITEANNSVEDMEGPPAGLDLLHENLPENWRRFGQRFELYLTAIRGANQPAKVQLFLHVAGEEAVEVFKNFTFEGDDDEHKLMIIMKEFEDNCHPKKNMTNESNKFFMCVQGDMQGDMLMSKYLTEFKIRSKSHEFWQLQEPLIRDQCVWDNCLKELKVLRRTQMTFGSGARQKNSMMIDWDKCWREKSQEPQAEDGKMM